MDYLCEELLLQLVLEVLLFLGHQPLKLDLLVSKEICLIFSYFAEQPLQLLKVEFPMSDVPLTGHQIILEASD